MTKSLDDAEMVAILTEIARDPEQVGLTRVRALSALRELEASRPPELEDGAVRSMAAFMDKRGITRPPSG